MVRSTMLSLFALLESAASILYRETRDVYYGFPNHPRWFIMRKLARFESVKSLINYLRRPTTQIDVDHDVLQYNNTIFRGVDTGHVLDCLRKDGVYVGLNLPMDVVEQIMQFTKDVHCYGIGKTEYGFYYDEKDKVSSKLNRTFSGAYYYNTANCKAIQTIVEDPLLLKIAGGYLGGSPVHQGTQLRWSFASDLSEFDKFRTNQTFHYDIDDYGAMKFFFYLTDVDIDDGPHICIIGSHKSKKFSHKLLRGIYNEEATINFYKKENVRVICGNSGYGFVEDIFIIHKGLTPVKHDRLILIVEYALRDYGMQHDRIQESQLKSIL